MRSLGNDERNQRQAHADEDDLAVADLASGSRYHQFAESEFCGSRFFSSTHKSQRQKLTADKRRIKADLTGFNCSELYFYPRLKTDPSLRFGMTAAGSDARKTP